MSAEAKGPNLDARSRYKFEVVSKDTPENLAKIGAPELSLLIQMLTSIGGPANAQVSMAAYGIRADGSFDEAQLRAYKNGNENGDVKFINPVTQREMTLPSLKKRFDAGGYTVFRLSDNTGKLLAVASGDLNSADARWQSKIQEAAALGGNYFRLLNVAVDETMRRKGVGTELLRQVNNWAVGQNVKLLEGPVSKQASEKGLAGFYSHAMGKFTVQASSEIDGVGQTVFSVRKPKYIRTEAELAATYVLDRIIKAIPTGNTAATILAAGPGGAGMNPGGKE